MTLYLSADYGLFQKVIYAIIWEGITQICECPVALLSGVLGTVSILGSHKYAISAPYHWRSDRNRVARCHFRPRWSSNEIGVAVGDTYQY